jgi:NADH dehydrogenase [ubiquinone] 1 alpha subcomplex assembly factor 5
MTARLFDHRLRALRRDRAARIGVEQLLYDRAFDDCLERLSDIRRDLPDVLLAGCPNPGWPARLGGQVTAIDPGPLMAARAGGQCADLENLPFEGASFDLVVSVGLLDTANNLPLAAAALQFVLKPGGLLLGAIAGGHGLPRLRQAMLAADAVSGQASPHVHPRIEAPGLANLLTAAGFAMPVVDVDRVEIGYPSLDSLVRDLRAMGMTNILGARSRRPIGRAAREAARAAFLGTTDRATEQLEILHFAAWKPA